MFCEANIRVDRYEYELVNVCVTPICFLVCVFHAEFY